MAKTNAAKRSVKTAAKTAPKAAKKAAGKTTKATAKKPASPQPAGLADRLDTLLHTVRCIAQHEDELCTLLHAARKNKRTTATLARELRSILAELPAEEYAWELRALEEQLDAAA
ncbi:hypothetical protein Terro_0942 [Terriglobus roseus DSM 18391]|uniref:Uncharacterized protein n=1 Tax=Terriglobus roseus (strain DSM 18391 / NRRL B-41598 / KBS 63) TaxID=926566 RepID=I3ZDE6_TERRK|nr:hypothetical protein [Terriglobus roseus]AFL87264.1 hypothetical protein Terro_0942 [Terriglobus roseus DSM 18391]